MQHSFKTSMADRFGVKSAVVAQYLWDKIKENDRTEPLIFEDRNWMITTYLMMSADMPYLTIHMIRNAIKKLADNHVIKRSEFNKSKYYHASWYSFTDFGIRLMTEASEMRDAV